MVSTFWDKDTEDELARRTGRYTRGGKEERILSQRLTNILKKNMFREHNQEADHCGCPGTDKLFPYLPGWSS